MTNQNNNNCSYTYNYHYYNCFNNGNNANNSSGNNHNHDNSGNCDTGTSDDNSNSESRDDSNNEDNSLSYQENLKDTNAFAAYEKAIEGYQFQVGRYNTWMNYYALFVGALFIALYSICTGESLVIKKEEVKYLLLLIAAIGWLASFCWYGALLGYRKWNDHWMKVIHKIETTKISIGSELDIYPLVYGDMPESDKLQDPVRYEPGFISTQKITEIFIFCVALAWCFVIGYVMNIWWIGLIISAASVLIIRKLRKKGHKMYSSSIPESGQNA